MLKLIKAFEYKSKTGRIWHTMEPGAYWISLPYICFPNSKGYWYTHTYDSHYINGPWDTSHQAMDNNKE